MPFFATRANFWREYRQPPVVKGCAGMGSLQVVLEAGFDAFATLARQEQGVARFPGLIEQREHQFFSSQHAPRLRMSNQPLLPLQIIVIERGWLSSNNILHIGQQSTALVDSGYSSHQQQTLALVQSHLGDRSLNLLLNTHLHSDHCGGNAALQSGHAELKTLIPPGQAAHVANWNEIALGYPLLGQDCPKFSFDDVLNPGSSVQLGDLSWEVHSAAGHDPHSVVLFQPNHGVLISADALWQNGFGIVFPELEGGSAFAEVSTTLDLIDMLDVRVVIPGHGPVFSEVRQALATARRRLDGFVQDPARHARHAIKALMKFKLLEIQSVRKEQFLDWAAGVPYFQIVGGGFFPGSAPEYWISDALEDLIRTGAVRQEGLILTNGRL